MIDTDKYEGHTPAPWRTGFAGVYCYDKDPDAKMVKITRTICKQPLHFDNENGDWVAYDGHTPANIAKIHPDQLLIADAPLLLEEYMRVTHALRYVGVSMYLDKNNYRHYDYSDMLDYIMEITGEPDDLSGEMGAMIQEMIE